MIGQTISHYRILEKLGGGGMGVVYKAEDTRLKRTVALKFLPPDLTRDEEAKARFVHEAQAASALQHPNICTIHDIDETADNQLFIVMDCYEGETLKQRIANGQLSIDICVDYASQVAQGLAKAHESGIVHRDIKPANIMIGKDGIVRIVDFGLAKLSGQTMLTKSGSTVGTAAYMSPEQARGEKVDHRTDIWSLGVVIYEMLTGHQPFESEYEQAMMYAIISAEPKPIEELRPEVPGNIIGIVQRAMEKDKEKRFHTTEEMAEALRGEGKPQKKRMSRSKKRMLWYVATASILVAAALGIFLTMLQAEVIDSIAVLRPRYISNAPENEALSAGILDGLINELGKIKALTIKARQSVMKFKKTDKTPAEIANELGNVKALVELSYQELGNKLQINARLIRASDGKVLMARDFDRNIEDVLVLHSEVARSIVELVRVAVTPQEDKALSRTRTVNQEAYAAYLRGRFFSRGSTEEGLKKALASFQRSIEIDSTFADAYGGLAGAYTNLALYGIQAPDEAYPRARAAAGKALELDETSVPAHTALAMILYQFDWKWAEAEGEYKRATNLNPSGGGHVMYGIYLTNMGRYDEAISEARRAVELNPVSPGTYLGLGFVLYYARRHDESIAQLRKALELDSTFGNAYMSLGLNYAQKRMYAEAVAACNRAIGLMPEEQFILAGCGFVYGLAGKRAEALKCLENLQRLSVRGHVDSYNMAWLYDGLGDNDQTLKWLERAYNERSASMPALRTETWTDRLRSDPRLQDLLRRMNFPQ